MVFTIYIGCRYCLTTNVIFGITDQSQCKKCKRTSFIAIDITLISSGNNNIDEFIYNTRIIPNIHNWIADYMKRTAKDSNPLDIYEFLKFGLIPLQLIIEWIPYSQITNLEKITEGGFGIIYKARYSDGALGYHNKTSDRYSNITTVAIKKFLNSKDTSKYFLNEVIIL